MEGSMGVIREERGCSGLSSEAEKLLQTKAESCACVCVHACASVGSGVFVSLNETMSFQHQNSRRRASSRCLKVTFPPPSLLFLHISPSAQSHLFSSTPL